MIQKRGQLTIFMILGIVIFLVFFFLLRLNQQVVLNELERGQESVASRLFQKEGLRIFVESCLNGELEGALLLLGEQGRIWDDQPGGTAIFSEGETGIMVEGKRVAYAQTRTPVSNSYPCLDDAGAPSFCQYPLFPNSASRSFGKGQRWERQITADLQQYLAQEARSCIDDYLQDRLPGAVVTADDFILTTTLQEDGILVEAVYPLGFHVGDEDFFHLSVFDFVYPTDLRKVLRATLTFPLDLDTKYADYHFTKEDLQSSVYGYTAADGTSVSIPKLENDFLRFSMDLDRQRTPSGDTVYAFTVPFPYALQIPGDYTFRFARQNRAPALDYVHRAECLVGANQYDYLVVKGDPAYGKIEVALNAIDPDEDGITDSSGVGEDGVEYRFAELSSLPSSVTTYLKKADDSDGILEGTEVIAQKMDMSKEEVLSQLPAKPEPYTFVVKAKDRWGQAQEDWQQVRMLVDDSIDPEKANVIVELPWGVSPDNIVSREDPFIIRIEPPLSSGYVSGTVQRLRLADGTELPVSSGVCLDFPHATNACDFFGYRGSAVESAFSSPLAPGYSSIISSPSLNVEYEATYCAAGAQVQAVTDEPLNLDVKTCLPHPNAEFPYPYIPGTTYYQQKFSLKSDETTDFDVPPTLEPLVDPFSVTHVCCTDTFQYAPITTVCHEVDGCFTNHFYLQTKTYKCGSSRPGFVKRGNMCNGDQELGAITTTCGDSSVTCDPSIPPLCQGVEKFSVIDGQGWCSTDTSKPNSAGCSSFCTSEVVYVGSALIPPNPKSFPDQFSCGCTGRAGKPCDGDFDGVWGTCTSSPSSTCGGSD